MGDPNPRALDVIRISRSAWSDLIDEHRLNVADRALLLTLVLWADNQTDIWEGRRHDLAYEVGGIWSTVKKALAHLEDRGLIAILEPFELTSFGVAWVKARPLLVPSRREQLRRERRSVVYAIQSGGRIKIGVTTDLRKRLKSLQTGSPLGLEVVAVMPGTAEMERYLHQRFAVYREEGEWFNFDPPTYDELIDFMVGYRNAAIG